MSDVDAAETYRWEDADGNVHYSDVPPPADARNIERARVDRGTPTVSLPYELQVAVNKYPVTLYVTDCGDPCDRARALLLERGIPHTLLDAMNPDVQRKLKALPGGQLEAPVAEVGYIVLRGFERGRWNSALDMTNYPRDAVIAVTPTILRADDEESEDDDADSNDEESDAFDEDDNVASDDSDVDDFDQDDFGSDDTSAADEETDLEEEQNDD